MIGIKIRAGRVSENTGSGNRFFLPYVTLHFVECTDKNSNNSLAKI
jgi:hypothetical protein